MSTDQRVYEYTKIAREPLHCRDGVQIPREVHCTYYHSVCRGLPAASGGDYFHCCGFRLQGSRSVSCFRSLPERVQCSFSEQNVRFRIPYLCPEKWIIEGKRGMFDRVVRPG